MAPAAPLLAALALLGVGTSARAQTTEKAQRTDRPWAEGVSEAAQKQALALFEEGNRLFENSEHAAALAKYQEALRVWDHPAIRFNAAVTLINLDHPLAANEHLELALRYGEAPFDADTHRQALAYRQLLHGRLTKLRVTCAEPGADVVFDGATLFVAPGEATRWVLPGAHLLVARKAGFFTATRSLSLVAGSPASESLSLQPIRTIRTRMVRRWPEWRPWAVLGGGAAVALAGAPVLLDARSSSSRAQTENVVAVCLFAVGGAAVASGVALLVLNQPRTSMMILNVDRASHPKQPPHVAVVPLVDRDVIGLSVALAR